MFKRKRFKSLISPETLIFGLIFIFILVFFIGGLNDANANSLEEGRKIAEKSLRKAAVSCYAFEGLYPANHEYLKKNYGVYIDEDEATRKYIVHYDSIMPNLMPDIGVYLNKK